MSERNVTMDTKKNKIYSQKEGDIFLKHNESPTSTAIAIRENQIVAHTSDGKIGLLINGSGDIVLQGKSLDVKSCSKSISRRTFASKLFGQEVTENPQDTSNRTGYTILETLPAGYPIVHTHSILPHVHEVVPGYLRKMPINVEMLTGVKGYLKAFLNAAQG